MKPIENSLYQAIETEFMLWPVRILEELYRRGTAEKLFELSKAAGTGAFTGLPLAEQAELYREFIVGGEPRVEVPDDYDAHVRKEEHDIVCRRLQSDQRVLNAKGKPFSKESSAEVFQAAFDLTDTHEIRATEGGFELRRLAPANRPSVLAAIKARQEADPEYIRQEAAYSKAKNLGEPGEALAETYAYGKIEIEDFEKGLAEIAARIGRSAAISEGVGASTVKTQTIRPRPAP